MFCCLFNIFIQRSKEFYEENAIQRNYFYFMDNRGQLFLEETKRRNVSIFLGSSRSIILLIFYLNVFL
jgi:hypothetical protein